MKKLLTKSLLIASLAISSYATEFVFVGTGSPTGVYYPTGGAICSLINKDKQRSGIRCSIESTAGSIYNINAIKNHELTLGVVQADVQSDAYKAAHAFEKEAPMNNLRSLFSLHAEPFTVVARADSGIKTFDDLKGKRVNIGNLGSGQRGTMDELMKIKGWDKKSFSQALEINSKAQNQALCDNEIDAYVYTVGFPSTSITEVTNMCDVNLVNVTGDAVDKLIENYPYFSIVTIPGGLYKNNPNPVKTFGVRATFVATDSLPTKTAYVLVKTIFENFEYFKSLNPVFESLNKKEMTTDGLTAPLHEGAKQYYEQVKWFKEVIDYAY